MRRLKVILTGKVEEPKSLLGNSDSAAMLLQETMSRTPETEFQEHFWVIPMDVKGRPLCEPYLLFKGAQDSSIVDQKILFRILLNVPQCTQFIVAHNHPTCDIQPSAADHAVTRKLKSAAEILGFRFLDHLIVSYNSPKFYSFRTEGYLE